MKPSREPGGAFTTIELVMVVASLAILAAILLPALTKSRVRVAKVGCDDNLKQIGLAFRAWAVDNHDMFPMQVSVVNGGTMELVDDGAAFPHFLVMSNELSTPKVLVCPEDSGRQMATSFQCVLPPAFPYSTPLTNDNNISYFVGVDASPSRPAMWLSGDANFAFEGAPAKSGLQQVRNNASVAWVSPRHNGAGNICFPDGSVQQAKDSQLGALLMRTGVATNRLALP